MTAELDLEIVSPKTLMIWWGGSVALAYNVQRSRFSCQQHTDTQTHPLNTSPSVHGYAFLRKKGLPNDEAKLWPQGGSSVTDVCDRTAECGHRNTYMGDSHEHGSSCHNPELQKMGGSLEQASLHLWRMSMSTPCLV